ncbi:NAD(P)H-hydrate dehydratase [Candidatus Poribacteria bacterium]|nr:NAD(P)H-hydrate dehydratase [Candidatus Poribacteria bacterium]
MIPVLSAGEMRAVDRHTIDVVGIPARSLMEHAGRALADRVRNVVGNDGSIAVVCGKGNNGGDGLVAARFLHGWGFRTTVYLTVERDELGSEPLACLQATERVGVPVSSISTPVALDATSFTAHAWLVDAILGTGLSGGACGHAARVIDRINASRRPALACDVPSGLDATTGQVAGPCIRARETLTIGFPKIGLLLYPGADYVGRLSTADIGFPRQAIDAASVSLWQVERSDAAARLPVRRKNAHKGDFGRVLLVAGSSGMAGAAALTSEAALRAGAGLVTLATPRAVVGSLASRLTEVMVASLPDTPDGCVSPEAVPSIRARAKSADVLAIGPGLSASDGARATMANLAADWSTLPTRMVIDADGLNHLAAIGATSLPAGAVLTPHPGEMARLCRTTVDAVEKDRIGIARSLSAECGAVVVLKGVPTVIAAPNGLAYLNPTGNPGMATAGSGDVLTGLIAGFSGQGLDPVDASILGVYLHGLAGDLAAATLGASLLAGDILSHVPSAMRALTTG